MPDIVWWKRERRTFVLESFVRGAANRDGTGLNMGPGSLSWSLLPHEPTVPGCGHVSRGLPVRLLQQLILWFNLLCILSRLGEIYPLTAQNKSIVKIN